MGHGKGLDGLVIETGTQDPVKLLVNLITFGEGWHNNHQQSQVMEHGWTGGNGF